MKKLLIFLVVIAAVQVFGQPERFGDHPPKKIEELYKIKLIEELQMDEETTLKFFSRHSKNREEIRQITDKGDELLDQMEAKISGNDKDEISSLVNAFLRNEEEVAKKKAEFVNSLYDILTPGQVAKFLVFESRFREEIRDILMKNRRRGPD